LSKKCRHLNLTSTALNIYGRKPQKTAFGKQALPIMHKIYKPSEVDVGKKLLSADAYQKLIDGL
jgi:hypothetical protein